ncbi:AAA family ATPase [Desulfatirhabdium butyrativorans]|uniref:AAA family ATPase n=1 Tax=Desulfatirhabdium butyrativorans TaxID=340467 RepID=UPI00040D8049|nr:AAA family ATPase [Desulfatirhabdium butyrativorans]
MLDADHFDLGDTLLQDEPSWINEDAVKAGKQGAGSKRFEKQTQEHRRIPVNEIDGETLLNLDFPEPEWIVRGMIPVGLTLLAGKPKGGKSLLMANLAIAMATGGRSLNIPFEGPERVVMFALEDSKRRLNDRFRKMIGDSGKGMSNILIRFEARRIGSGFEDDLQGVIERHKPRLVIIDTLAKVKPSSNGRKAAYDEDYGHGDAIKRIIDQHEIGCVVVHHTRKMGAEDCFDTVSGTLGLTAAFDTLAVLQRRKDHSVLAVRGRDIEDTELAIRLDGQYLTWQFLGNPADVQVSTERQEIIRILKEEGGPLRPKSIADMLGKRGDSTRHLLRKLLDAGVITYTDHGYLLK